MTLELSPVRLGRVLRDHLWTNEALRALVPDDGYAYGWNDGGCLLLADALIELFPAAVRVAIVAGTDVNGQHILIRLGSRYIDANGAFTEAALLRRWSTVEGLRNPRVLPLAEVTVSAGIPRDPDRSGLIARYVLALLEG